jgi:maltose alpha-D-glucosyltransferase / alpha-amylase
MVNDRSAIPSFSLDAHWQTVLEPPHRATLENALPAYVRERRWFGGKARRIAGIDIEESIAVPYADDQGAILFLRVRYADGDERYVLPVAAAWGAAAQEVAARHPHAVIAHLYGPDGTDGVLHDAVIDPLFTTALLHAIQTGQAFRGTYGSVAATTTSAFTHLRGTETTLPARVMGVEQSNTSVVYGDQLILKLFRRRDEGINPDLEIGRFLTEVGRFDHIPPVAGALEYEAESGVGGSLAILQGFVANQGDAWAYTLDQLRAFWERVRHDTPPADEGAFSTEALLRLAAEDIPDDAQSHLGDYAQSAALLGKRTAEMHLALASDATDPQFAPEPFTLDYQREVYDSLAALVDRVFRTMRDRMDSIPVEVRADAQAVLDRQDTITQRFKAVLDHPIAAQRIRYHGDYHLGQVLYTGDDFYIIDFEGEPARPLAERRRKRCALQDVAGMLRSFNYAAYAALFDATAANSDAQRTLEPWARAWYRWTNTIFLRSYLETVGDAPFIPSRPEELQLLLDIFLLEKGVYELGYELNNRPDWIKIPLQGVRQLLEG